MRFSSPAKGRNAQPTNDREAAPHAPARHGRGVHTTTGGTPNPATEFRGTLGAAGGSSVELAAEPGAGASAERCPSAGSGLHGGYRLPCSAGPGQAGGAFADSHVRLGPASAAYFSGGADRNRKNVSGAGVRTEGLPRRIHRILRHGRTIVPGTGTGAGRWQLREEASDAGPGGCADRRRLGDGTTERCGETGLSGDLRSALPDQSAAPNPPPARAHVASPLPASHTTHSTT